MFYKYLHSAAKRLIICNVCILFLRNVLICINLTYDPKTKNPHLKQLPVRDEPVVVHVVYSERKPKLGQLVALHAELRHALDELLKVHLAVTVRVEDVYDALNERILLQLRQRHELVDAQGARVVQVELLEALAQTPDLVGVD